MLWRICGLKLISDSKQLWNILLSTPRQNCVGIRVIGMEILRKIELNIKIKPVVTMALGWLADTKTGYLYYMAQLKNWREQTL